MEAIWKKMAGHRWRRPVAKMGMHRSAALMRKPVWVPAGLIGKDALVLAGSCLIASSANAHSGTGGAVALFGSWVAQFAMLVHLFVSDRVIGGARRWWLLAFASAALMPYLLIALFFSFSFFELTSEMANVIAGAALGLSLVMPPIVWLLFLILSKPPQPPPPSQEQNEAVHAMEFWEEIKK
jgi:hypothetical protein